MFVYGMYIENQNYQGLFVYILFDIFKQIGIEYVLFGFIFYMFKKIKLKFKEIKFEIFMSIIFEV